jgi:hypothetical protein
MIFVVDPTQVDIVPPTEPSHGGGGIDNTLLINGQSLLIQVVAEVSRGLVIKYQTCSWAWVEAVDQAHVVDAVDIEVELLLDQHSAGRREQMNTSLENSSGVTWPFGNHDDPGLIRQRAVP